MIDRLTVWLRPRHYRLSVSVFGRKSCFTFGGTYSFGRMCDGDAKGAAAGPTIRARTNPAITKLRPAVMLTKNL